MEERDRDDDQEIELHDGIAKDADPGVVMAIHHRDYAERSENPLDQDVHGNEKGRDAPALREHEPPEQVGYRNLLFVFCAHLANPISTAAMTTEARAHKPNIVSTMRREGTGRSSTLRWMITPARLRNVTL